MSDNSRVTVTKTEIVDLSDIRMLVRAEANKIFGYREISTSLNTRAFSSGCNHSLNPHPDSEYAVVKCEDGNTTEQTIFRFKQVKELVAKAKNVRPNQIENIYAADDSSSAMYFSGFKVTTTARTDLPALKEPKRKLIERIKGLVSIW